jgi:hypothetical protein
MELFQTEIAEFVEKSDSSVQKYGVGKKEMLSLLKL